MARWSVPEDTLRHIYEKHGDLIKALKIRSIAEFREVIMRILENPDEVHVDKFRRYVRYFLKKIDDLWINVVLLNNIVKTAYLLSSKSYRKFEEKRWL